METRKAVQSDVNQARTRLYLDLADLHTLNGEDNYEEGLIDILKATGSEGATGVLLGCVFPDSAKLAEVREQLVKDGKIRTEKMGNSYRLWLM